MTKKSKDTTSQEEYDKETEEGSEQQVQQQNKQQEEGEGEGEENIIEGERAQPGVAGKEVQKSKQQVKEVTVEKQE